jgi:phosphate transport system substrate-binding protein
MKRWLTALLLALFVATGCQPSQSPGTEVPSTQIDNKGSDTMVNLALAWAEAYQAAHPQVEISVTGGGSGTGFAALMNNTVDIANASRAIKPEEVEQAQANGIEPIEHIVARDAIGIVVHPENPVSKLTIQQLSDIYSGKISNWKEVGGADLPIVRLSREVNSGTHVYFLEEVVRLGEADNKTLFSPTTLRLPSSEVIINEVRSNPNAIGYDGLGYLPEDLKIVSVAEQASGPFVLPSVETVNNRTYPLARDLFMYTPGEPEGVVKEFLEWILSTEAQDIVAGQGFVPISESPTASH